MPLVVGFVDETLKVWCTAVDLAQCWLTVVLSMVVWVLANVAVATGGGAAEHDVTKMSVYYNTYVDTNVAHGYHMTQILMRVSTRF